jgi:hypothetical protein
LFKKLHKKNELLSTHKRNFDLNQYSYIFTEGIRGGNILSLENSVDFIFDLNPDVLVIDIGSNDLCSLWVGPQSLAQQIFVFANNCLSSGKVKQVIIIETFRRSKDWHDNRRSRNSSDYNRAVQQTNEELITYLFISYSLCLS